MTGSDFHAKENHKEQLNTRPDIEPKIGENIFEQNLSNSGEWKPGGVAIASGAGARISAAALLDFENGILGLENTGYRLETEFQVEIYLWYSVGCYESLRDYMIKRKKFF